MIPLEELQEAGLSACGSFDAPEAQVVSCTLKITHVHDQILQPQTSTLPDCSQLSWSENEERDNKTQNQPSIVALNEEKFERIGNISMENNVMQVTK